MPDRKGNMELKLALSHIRTWFQRNMVRHDGLTLIIRTNAERDIQEISNVFLADMNPSELTLFPVENSLGPYEFHGVKLLFESENAMLKHIGIQELRIAELHEENNRLRDELRNQGSDDPLRFFQDKEEALDDGQR